MNNPKTHIQTKTERLLEEQERLHLETESVSIIAFFKTNKQT